MSVNAFYELTLQLIDKTKSTPTVINEGLVVNGDLNPFRVRLELVNTGNRKTDNGVMTIQVPPDGTFVRTGPILVDEGAKDRYLIQAQIKQNDGAGGLYIGKPFRFTIGIPTIQDDVNGGETLKLQLLPLEYRFKETLDSMQLKFFTPSDAFSFRLFNYNENKGLGGITGIIDVPNFKLPDDEALRQNWEPLAPAKSHDLMVEVIERLSIPSISGGTYTDYFFDVKPFLSVEDDLLTGDTTVVSIRAGKLGGIDSGVTIDPLTFEVADTEKDKTINVDLQTWKNNIILECAPDAGRLPMEQTRFSSNWVHAQARPEWEIGETYYDENDPDNPQSLVKVTLNQTIGGEPLTIIRYFKCQTTHTSSAGNIPSGGTTHWFEDFTVIPEWTEHGEYGLGSVVTEDVGTTRTFYIGLADIFPTHNPAQNPSGGGSAFWSPLWTKSTDDSNDFFSYTPWTADYDYQFANISATAGSDVPKLELWDINELYDANDEVEYNGKWYRATAENDGLTPSAFPLVWVPLIVATGLVLRGLSPLEMEPPVPAYIGCIPDWNLERVLYDRKVASDQFENVTFKAVERVETNSNFIAPEEKYNGARFLIDTNVGGGGLGDFSGHNNEIAEWYDPPVLSTSMSGEWRFSKPSGDFESDSEECLDLKTGIIKHWRALWRTDWAPNRTGDVGKSSIMHAISDSDGLETAFGLVTGASGIPAQAIRIKYSWDDVYESRFNLSSRGAWWVQHLPIPKININSKSLGEKFNKSTLDATNLDFDTKGNQGWNTGLDCEDFGPLRALRMKVRLTAENSEGELINGMSNLPFKAWAVDIFGRVWYNVFSLKRNGEYSTVEVAFGNQAPKKIYHSRHDELFSFLGFTFSQNFFLKEKEYTGIEFDWRFVRRWGIQWDIAYDDNGMYIGARDSWINSLKAHLHQLGHNTLVFLGLPPEHYVIDRVYLDIDELAFSKTLYVNSDDVPVTDARTELKHLSQERDYLNAKNRAKGMKGRSKFINQSWMMKSHGDVRMKFGDAFKATGSRVPEQATIYPQWSVIATYSIGDKVHRDVGGIDYVFQAIKEDPTNLAKDPSVDTEYWTNLNELACHHVKHIIDSDGYMMEITGIRKFVYGG